MGATKTGTSTATQSAAPSDGETAVRRRIKAVMAGLWPREPVPDRRKRDRCVYPHLVKLTPVNEQTHEPVDESLVVVGKHLSEEGFDFYHCQSLPHRWMIATLDQPQNCEVSLLLELTWCRFNKQGWYDSGGRFKKVVATPTDSGEMSNQTASP